MNDYLSAGLNPSDNIKFSEYSKDKKKAAYLHGGFYIFLQIIAIISLFFLTPKHSLGYILPVIGVVYFSAIPAIYCCHTEVLTNTEIIIQMLNQAESVKRPNDNTDPYYKSLLINSFAGENIRMHQKTGPFVILFSLVGLTMSIWRIVSLNS
jgi:hypothetical protein